MKVRLRIIDYPRLRGLKPADPVKRGRLLRICGVMLWRGA